MESGNKITQHDLSSKEYFLKNSLAEYEQPNIYSLEDEFAKTKKNPDRKPYLIFFGFIFFLVLSTILVTHFLDVKSKQISIDISDFEDLRLKETLSAAKEKGQELDRKTAELDRKAKELDSKKGEIRNLKSSFNNEVQKAKEEIQQQADLENTDQKALQRLGKKGQKQLDQMKASYEAQLAKKQAEILRLQEQIKNYENKAGESKAYQYGLNVFLKEKKAIGCIIDPRQRKNIIVFFTKDPKLTNETIVSLYRRDDEYIGEIKLIPSENGVRCEMVEAVKNQTFKPFDWFKIE
jgi:DNA repair exonuclease SbcCD ATPase subunit